METIMWELHDAEDLHMMIMSLTSDGEGSLVDDFKKRLEGTMSYFGEKLDLSKSICFSR